MQKKGTSRFRAQQSLIQLADFFDLILQAAVVCDPLFHHWLLIGAKADVPDLAARLADRQNQYRMALPTLALRTARFVAYGALQQGSAQ
jgi:hypothetical protein